MDIEDHISSIKNLIKDFNKEFVDPMDIYKTPEVHKKEHKMPFEMKVFKKRVQKHDFYRNRHKTKRPTQVIVNFNEYEKNIPEEPTKVKKTWASYNSLEKKYAVRNFLRSINMPDKQFTHLYSEIWNSICLKQIKAKHVLLTNDKIKDIKGLIQMDNGNWIFNSSELFL
tara:strand:+ start:1804 stop:2310 length:507 start_codon:yes stop_codon:yes gene_type:complete